MDKLYDFIFENTYNKTLEDLQDEEAAKIREDVVVLRKSYQDKVCVTNYNMDRLRRAYMICYFPYYLDPAYDLLKNSVIPLIKENIMSNNKVCLSYFAGGPCPELVGTLKAFRDSGINKKFEVRILDYEQGWKEQRKITQKVIKKYLPEVKLSLQTFSGCDLMLDCGFCNNCWEYCKNELYRKTDIYFMQNCLNHIYQKAEVVENIKNKISYAKSGAIFVIIDLKYDRVEEIMGKFIKDIEGAAKVVATNVGKEVASKYFNEVIPDLLKKKIFNGQDGLKAKKLTKYYYAVLIKG
ncbi:hypothetical protein N3C_2398 [Clostridium sp. N3C]|uniref:hypothetical protein n=1 Tax=Clostridium sp. N3C TaxID=1776758 RepID=UPI00092E1E8D|nr:hypothetical protein [Clostridium sp. N3C]NLZ35185.1 hypothetical protein [Clostridiales bacterium]SCN25615.1 hypothetical protein N3C_2398 [Clostridium sp. N3C]